MKYSYEYNEGPILAIDSRIDWFFQLEVLETVYGGEICIEECHDRYIHSGLVASRAGSRNPLV